MNIRVAVQAKALISQLFGMRPKILKMSRSPFYKDGNDNFYLLKLDKEFF